jgi:protein ImuB
MKSPQELYACLYVREFPAQALMRLRPELEDKAVVVLEGEPPLQTVCSLNAKARGLGIVVSMTRVELDTFSGSAILPRSRAEESAARAVLLECAGAFSPRVEDRSQNAAFVCVLDIAGTEKLLGTAQNLAQTLRCRVRALGIVATVTVSSNVLAAVCLARGAGGRKGTWVVAAGGEAAALAPLLVAVLDLSEQQAETLAQWGIHTLGMLAGLPERALIARLGQEGRRLRQLAGGASEHLFLPVDPVFRLEERMELDTPVEALDSLLFVIGVMLEQLILRATARVLALASVSITLTLEGKEAHVRAVRPALPSNDRQLWIKLLHLDLEAHPPQAAILAVQLAAEPGGTSKVQLGLFSPQLPEPMRLDVTLARIRAIVGEQGVGSPVLGDTHRPDGFGMTAFRVGMGSSLAASASEATATSSVAVLRQLRPPEIVTVAVREQRPVGLDFRGKHYAVEQAYGPWRSSGDWWNPEQWSCEQWDLVARSGEGSPLCCCVVRERSQRVWQMAAVYD